MRIKCLYGWFHVDSLGGLVMRRKHITKKMLNILLVSALLVPLLMGSCKVKSADEIDCIQLGKYPQKEIAGEALTEDIKSASYVNGYATIDGNTYCKLDYFHEPDGTITYYSSPKYYLCEDITWRVFNQTSTTKMLIATKALDYQMYSETDHGSFLDSNLYTWLCSTFKNNAFQDLQTKPEVSVFSKVTAITISYGFTANTTASESRVFPMSDYCKGLSNTTGYAEYWMQEGYVNNDGSLETCQTGEKKFNKYRAVVPIVTITETGTKEQFSDTSGQKLSAPSDVKVVTKTAKSHRITWKKVEGAAGYQIYFSNNKKSNFTLKATTSKTSKTIKKLKKGKMYYYKVCAYDTDETGKMYSGVFSSVKKKKAGIPQQPSLKTSKIVKAGSKGILCQWSNISDADGIEIYSSINNGKYNKLFSAKLNQKTRKGCILHSTYTSGTMRVKIRTYCTVKGKKLYSRYSKAKRIKL